MSRFKTKRPNDVYNQAIERNEDYFRVYLDWLIGIALNRFEWVNLPETCDARTLEYMLLTHGCATIARPPETAPATDMWFSLGAVYSGQFDIYGNPMRWRTWSQWSNRWDFDCTRDNGVFAWANNSRRNPWVGLEKWAGELAKIKRTREQNRLVQATPFAINCPPESRKDAENMLLSIMSGQPAVGFIKDKTGELLTDMSVINVNVPYQPDEFDTDMHNAMGEALNFLGIDYLPRKQERVIEEEVSANSDGVYKKRLDDWNTRKKMADDFNRLTGGRYNVSVKWAAEQVRLKEPDGSIRGEKTDE